MTRNRYEVAALLRRDVAFVLWFFLLALASCGSDRSQSFEEINVPATSTVVVPSTSVVEVSDGNDGADDSDGATTVDDIIPSEAVAQHFDLDLRAEVVQVDGGLVVVSADLAYIEGNGGALNVVESPQVRLDLSPGVELVDGNCRFGDPVPECFFEQLDHPPFSEETGPRLGVQVIEMTFSVDEDTVDPTVTMTAESFRNTVEFDPDPSNNVVTLSLVD